MVKSQTTSITPAQHADTHRTGGTDPLTGAVGIDPLISIVDHGSVQVAAGSTPVAWTDLDLSAQLGAGMHLVTLRFIAGAAGYRVAVRQNGDTNDYFDISDHPFGIASGYALANHAAQLTCLTDANGIIEWIAHANVAGGETQLVSSIEVV